MRRPRPLRSDDHRREVRDADGHPAGTPNPVRSHARRDRHPDRRCRAHPRHCPFGDQDIDGGAAAAQTVDGHQQRHRARHDRRDHARRHEPRRVHARDRQPRRLHPRPRPLTADATCTLRVTFNPTATGPHTATLTVASNAADITVTLTGEGIQTELSRDPATLPFGDQDVDDGPTTTQTATITNSGTEPVTLTTVALGGGGAAQFERLTGEPGDCATAATLTAGQTCTLRARFDPTSTGAKSGALTVASNAADVTVALTGSGTQPSCHAHPQR